MKILCVSDQIDPVIYSKDIKTRYADTDVIISAGDLPIEYLDFIQSSLNKPLFFVFGGHYLKALTHYHPEMAEKIKNEDKNTFKKNNPFKSKNGTYIGFKTCTCGNLLIAGISGTKKQNDGKNQFTEKQMERKLLALLPSLIKNKIKYGRYLDILVSHAPIASENGFKCFERFAKIFKPKYWLHGNVHIHNSKTERKTTLEETEVINVYSRHVLEIL